MYIPHLYSIREHKPSSPPYKPTSYLVQSPMYLQVLTSQSLPSCFAALKWEFSGIRKTKQKKWNQFSFLYGNPEPRSAYITLVDYWCDFFFSFFTLIISIFLWVHVCYPYRPAPSHISSCTITSLSFRICYIHKYM